MSYDSGYNWPLLSDPSSQSPGALLTRTQIQEKRWDTDQLKCGSRYKPGLKQPKSPNISIEIGSEPHRQQGCRPGGDEPADRVQVVPVVQMGRRKRPRIGRDCKTNPKSQCNKHTLKVDNTPLFVKASLFWECIFPNWPIGLHIKVKVFRYVCQQANNILISY